MMVTKKMRSLPALVLVLGLGVGCELSTSPEDDDIDVYSYNVEELAPGLFGAMSPEMTMNEWYMGTRPSWVTPEPYDSWSQREKIFLYQDEALKTPFEGSDIINENTIIYCDYSFNGQGKQIGEITGTITLTDIPLPDTTKVYINSVSYSGYPSNWWSLNRKIDMSGVTGTSPVNWSLPVYESLQPNSQATFQLIVLPGDSLKAYTVSVPTQKTISDANANVGDLGTVSVKGVTLSGTITVTSNGQPVPYIEMYALHGPASSPLGITCLSSPGPNTPWSVTFGPDNNNNKEMTFQIFYYSGKNGTFLFDKYVSPNPSVYVVNNQSVSGIVLDVTE